jgi:hypothetical protein
LSVEVMAWVWEHSMARGTARLVLLAIADHAGPDGRNAWPSQQRLARKCRVSVRTVRRAIDELVALEELDVEEYGGPIVDGREGRRTHRYAVRMLADDVTGNGEDVRGQECEVGGQKNGGLSDIGVRGTVSNRPSEPSAPIASKEDRLVARMVDHFGARYYAECREIVMKAAQTHDHNVIDEAIGRAIAQQK